MGYSFLQWDGTNSKGQNLPQLDLAGTHVSALGFLHNLLVQLCSKWDSGQNFKAKETF